MKNKYRVNEVFTSIQGEGTRVGRPAVFVRFSGCVRTCSFCDTRHDTWEHYGLDDLITIIDKETRLLGTNIDCVLTGGEPLLQIDAPLVRALKTLGYVVCIETSGDQLIEEQRSDFSSVLAMLKRESPELTVSPKSVEYSVSVLKRATCLKVVCPMPFDVLALDTMIETLSRHGGREQCPLVLQPITPTEGTGSWKWKSACKEALSLAVHRKIHRNEIWRIIPQTHAMMGFK